MKSLKKNLKDWLLGSTIANSKYLQQIVITFIIISMSSANAQDMSIKGFLLINDTEPLVFATVSLLNAKDSTLIKATISDVDGKYAFNSISAGEYVVSIQAMGFITKVSSPFLYSSTPILMDPIAVKPSTETLQEVVVATRRPTFQRQDDKLIINVAGTALAKGNNAIDILDKAPGVSVDSDGAISLNGKSGVTVMINEKLTYLSNSQLATMLRSTNGNTIQAIEIMNNPSAKYDASGNSGIINIKLKKNKDEGFNGSVILGVGQAYNLSNNGSLSQNVKFGKVNAFATISRTNAKKFIKLASNREIDSSGFKTLYSQRSKIKDGAKNNFYRIGADYETGKNNTIGFVINGNSNNNDVLNNGIADINEQLNNNSSRQISTSNDSRTTNNIGINLNNRVKLDTLGKLLSVDLDYINYKNNGKALLTTLFDNSNGNGQQVLPYFLRQNTPSTIVVQSAKVDYVYPASKTFKIEAGVKLSSVKTDNTIEVQNSSNNVNFAFNSQLSNQFVYNERIQAAYLSSSKTFEKTTLQFGLRSEYTHSKGTLVNSANAPISKKYLDFFPNLFVLQTLNEKSKLSLNLSRRIERPSYESLNPFAYYIDPYTRELGNPFLKPQYANNLDLNYNYNRFNIGLSYGHTTNVNTETVVTDTITKISSVTTINLNSLDRYTISTSSSFAVYDWWSGNINGYLICNNYNLKGSSSVSQNNKNVSYNIKSTQNFRVNNNLNIELNGRYQSNSIFGLYRLRYFTTIDAGVNHSFWSNKANLKFSINDIFNGRKTDLILETKGTHVHGYQKNDTRVVKLVFTYNFGSKNLRAINRQSGVDEEKARVK